MSIVPIFWILTIWFWWVNNFTNFCPWQLFFQKNEAEGQSCGIASKVPGRIWSLENVTGQRADRRFNGRNGINMFHENQVNHVKCWFPAVVLHFFFGLCEVPNGKMALELNSGSWKLIQTSCFPKYLSVGKSNFHPIPPDLSWQLLTRMGLDPTSYVRSKWCRVVPHGLMSFP